MSFIYNPYKMSSLVHFATSFINNPNTMSSFPITDNNIKAHIFYVRLNSSTLWNANKFRIYCGFDDSKFWSEEFVLLDQFLLTHLVDFPAAAFKPVRPPNERIAIMSSSLGSSCGSKREDSGLALDLAAV